MSATKLPELVSYLSGLFLLYLVRVHHLCETPPPEYPATLQSQLLVLNRIFDRLENLLQRLPDIFTRCGREEAFQLCVNACLAAATAFEHDLNSYGDVVSDESRWNETAKPAVIKFNEIITSLVPYHRATTLYKVHGPALTSPQANFVTSKTVEDIKKFLDKFDADAATLNDNDSTLTGQTLRGVSDVPEEKAAMGEGDGDSLDLQLKGGRTVSVVLEQAKSKQRKPGGRLTRFGFRVLNVFYPSSKCKDAMALHKAIEKGSNFKLRLRLFGGADIESRNSKDMTPLHSASRVGNFELVRTLLEWKANVNVQAQGFGAKTPIMIATGRQDAHIAQLLVDHGANLELVDTSGRTALLKATEQYESLLGFLIKAGANIECLGTDFNRPLHNAATVGNHRNVTQLLAAGADVNATNIRQESALHFSCRKPDLPLVQALLDKGADVNAYGMRWETPLMAAIKLGDVRLVQTLIKAGADLEAENTEKHRAIHFAVFWNKPKIIQELLQAGAEVDPRGRFGETPLTLAAQDGYYDCAITLLIAGADRTLLQGSPKGVVVGDALACARRWGRSEKLTDVLQKLESGEIEKVTEAHLAGLSEKCRDPTTIKAWMSKFVVEIYERETG